MSFEAFWTNVVNTIKPVKSIFAFYVILYLLPTAFFLYIAFCVKGKLFNGNTSEINIVVAIILAICGIFVLGWTLFYLLFFTNQRTKNPHLYKKGFMSDYSIKCRLSRFYPKEIPGYFTCSG